MRIIHQTDVDGCHVAVEEIRPGYYFGTVSYKVYNALGVHVASPEWQTLGGADEVKKFIIQTVADAQKDNCPPAPVLDTFALLFPQMEIVQ